MAAPLAGALSDRLGERWRIVIGALVLGAVSMALLTANALVAILIGIAGAALVRGSSEAMVTALTGDLVRTEQRGRAIGLVHTASDLGSAIAPPIAYLLLPYPLAHVPLLGLVLFRAYLWVNRGGSPNLVAMSLVAVMILPLMSMNQDSRDAGLVLSLSFLGSAGLAVFVQWMAHVALPDPGRPSAPSPSDTREMRSTTASALKSTLVVLPVAVLFLVMNWASEVLVLVFVAIFSLTAEAAESRRKGKVMLAANLIGATATVVFYWLIVAVPEYAFFVTLMLLTMLCFGRAVFALDPLAEYMTPACIGLLVLIAGSMTPQADSMDRPFERAVMISLAALYTVAALGVLDRGFVWREERGC